METENETTEKVFQVEKPDSIKVSRTSTGKYSFEIKLYYNAEKTQYREINERISMIESDLKARFKEE